MIAGCGADVLVNICFTLLGYVFLMAATVSPTTHFESTQHSNVEHTPNMSHEVYANTSNSYFPGHIHAFYLEYVYFERRGMARQGQIVQHRAPGVYSDNIQRGGGTQYGTV